MILFCFYRILTLCVLQRPLFSITETHTHTRQPVDTVSKCLRRMQSLKELLTPTPFYTQMMKLRLIILSKITNSVGGRVENPLHYSFCLSRLGITKFFIGTNDFFNTLINFLETLIKSHYNISVQQSFFYGAENSSKSCYFVLQSHIQP